MIQLNIEHGWSYFVVVWRSVCSLHVLLQVGLHSKAGRAEAAVELLALNFGQVNIFEVCLVLNFYSIGNWTKLTERNETIEIV